MIRLLLLLFIFSSCINSRKDPLTKEQQIIYNDINYELKSKVKIEKWQVDTIKVDSLSFRRYVIEYILPDSLENNKENAIYLLKLTEPSIYSRYINHTWR